MGQKSGKAKISSVDFDGIPERSPCPECEGEATRVYDMRIGYHLSCNACGCEFYDVGNVVRHGSEHTPLSEKAR